MTTYEYQVVQPEHLLQLSNVLPQVLPGNWSEESLRSMQANAHQLRVMLAGSTPVAFAEFQWVVDECQLFNIATLPGWQQRGLGTQLLNKLLQESNQRGMKTCVLEVRESNSAARALYRKAGFRETGRRTDYYPAINPVIPGSSEREAAVLYCCELSGGAGS